MYPCFTLSEPATTPRYRHAVSINGAITAWELKNLALNTKGFVTCPKNYSEFLL